MKKSLIAILIVLGIILVIGAILVGWFVGAYNNFVVLDQNVNSKWSEVESQYQRQADLIPNFVSSVSSQVGVETAFVKDVIDARTQWMNAQSDAQKDAAGQTMNAGITAFVNAVSENYPTLMASEGYTALRDEMAGTQNRITVARGNYIQSIQAYNTAIKRFPSNILAGMFGFGAKEYYEAEDGSMQTPQLGNGTLP
jgi:LemA protein